MGLRWSRGWYINVHIHVCSRQACYADGSWRHAGARDCDGVGWGVSRIVCMCSQHASAGAGDWAGVGRVNSHMYMLTVDWRNAISQTMKEKIARRSLENRNGGAWKIETSEVGKWRRRSLENGDVGAWKMETSELGKWRRRSLENWDGGPWNMGTVELGRWGRWSLENGDGGALKMRTVEHGKWRQSFKNLAGTSTCTWNKTNKCLIISGDNASEGDIRGVKGLCSVKAGYVEWTLLIRMATNSLQSDFFNILVCIQACQTLPLKNKRKKLLSAKPGGSHDINPWLPWSRKTPSGCGWRLAVVLLLVSLFLCVFFVAFGFNFSWFYCLVALVVWLFCRFVGFVGCLFLLVSSRYSKSFLLDCCCRC